MSDHWDENGPPVYIAVAGYLGMFKKDKDKKRDFEQDSPTGIPGPEQGGNDPNELVHMLSETGGILSG